MLLLDGFLALRKQQPLYPALVEEERSLTYSELHNAACKVASRLAQMGINPTAPVAIALDRGIDATTAIFGVLYTGCCYMPLDLKNPVSRLRFIVEDARTQVIIGNGNCPEWVQKDCFWLDIEQLEHCPIDFEITPSSSETLGAILYTSGSTGTPKGVALSRRAISAFANWAGQIFKVRQTDRIASLAPFYFDLSIFDIFTGLNNGATVHFVPAGLTLYPSRLSEWLKTTGISIWYTVPSLLCFLALKGNLSQTRLTDLRCILFAGEVFPTPQLIRLGELLPKTQFFNLFGPTETNVCCYWPVDLDNLESQQSIPIGSPAGDMQLRIDPGLNELLVKGPTLFSGYWKAGRLENRVDPSAWFRTGDRASLNNQGEFQYHGRLDRMLKCSGYRIEPAEIEAAINSIPNVIQSAVIGIRNSAGGHHLAAAIASPSHHQPAQINLAIRAALPRYMWPSKVAIVTRLPVVASGKIDYAGVERLLQDDPKGLP